MQLGVLAGIDESTASGRINQYERGRHVPDLRTAKLLSNVLKVPLPYLFCDDEDIAHLLRLLHGMSKVSRRKLIETIGTS